MANMASSTTGSASASPSGPVACPSGFIGTRPKGARDFAWKYAFEGTEYNSVICIKCERQIRGGISRLKYHLAGIEKRDTRVCGATTEEIKREMIALLSAQEEKKLKKERAKLAMRASIYESQGIPATLDEEEEALEGIVGSFRGPRIRAQNTPTRGRSSGSGSTFAGSSRPQNSSIDGYFVHRNTPGAQPSLEGTGWNRDVHEQLDIQCADFWYFNKLPFNVAASPYFLNFVTGCTVAGKGYKPPTPAALSGRLLKDAVSRGKDVVEEQKLEWKQYGCTILSDGWTDGRNRTIINFLISCKDQVIFLKSLDASDKIKTAETLALMLENVVMEIGAENVVQIITDNAAAYVAAGRILEEKHNTLFWSPCAAHVIDLLLEDIGKLDWVKPVVEEARKITKYIYNHPWVLRLMRDYTEDKELVRPAVTRFATIFLTLQSVLHHMNHLRQMFVCPKWLQSSYSKKADGQSVARIVFDIQFFDRATEIVEVVKPLVRVLRLVDGDQTPMGCLYEAMDRAKEAVRNKYRGESHKFQPIWDIIDRRWSNQLHQPLHAAGYFLNPCYRFSPSYADPNGEVMEGFSECMQRMVPDIAVRDLIVAEMEVYQNATGKLFSSALAKRGRHTQTPDAWWRNWGGNVPNLQKLALRILCQPCSSSSCERNWSLFESIHTKKRNKLEQKRLNDLVFVHYNLKLRIRKVMSEAAQPLDLDDIDPFGDWTAQEQPSLFTEDDIYELERQAMEEEGFAVGLDDIQEEGGESEDTDSEHSDSEDEEDEEDEESLPGPAPPPPPPPPQTTATARAARPSPSPIVFTRTTGKGKGKRKM